LAIGLASCLNAALLFRGLRQKNSYSPSPGWGRFLLKLALALAMLTATLWFGMGKETDWLLAPALERIVRLSAVISAGIAVYFGTLWLAGFRLQDFRQRGTSS
jgi:putative peptidoglycan lipid II flippase